MQAPSPCALITLSFRPALMNLISNPIWNNNYIQERIMSCIRVGGIFIFHTADYQFLHQVEGNKSMMIHDEDWQSECHKSFCFIFSLSTLHSKLVYMAVRDINYFLLYNDGTKVIRHPTGFVMCCTKIGAFSLGPVIQNLYLLFCTSTVLSSFFLVFLLTINSWIIIIIIVKSLS